MTVVMTILTVIVSGTAAYWLALRKGNREHRIGWTILGSLLPISLPLLTAVGRRKGAVSQTRWFAIPLIVAANVLVVVEVGIELYGLSYAGFSDGLPACDSPAARDTAMQALAGSPSGKLLGLAIVDMTQMSQISSTPSERACKARVSLNNGSDRSANYQIYTHDGATQWFLKLELEEE